MNRIATVPMTSSSGNPAWAPVSKAAPLPAHKTLGWKPASLPYNPMIGQTSPAAARATALGVVLVPTAVAATVSFVGFRLGMKDQGIPSVLGYVVGAFAGISAVMGLLAMLGIAVLPFGAQSQTVEAQPII